MKPAYFHYSAPQHLEEALRLLRQCGPDAKILAGGQSLMPLLNMRLVRPMYVLDINRLSELNTLAIRDNYVAIGAITRQRQVELSPLVQQHHPFLVEVVRHIGHTQIRNRGTVAGSIAHADPAAELPALLTCLNGEVITRSASGTRTIKAASFFTDALSTTLEPDEILTEVHLPLLPAQAGWACMEFSRRSGDFALAGALAVLVPAHDGRCQSSYISYFGISTTPVRAYSVEKLLVGTKLDKQTLHAASETATHLVHKDTGDTHATPAYRQALIAELTTRVLTAAWSRKTSERG